MGPLIVLALLAGGVHDYLRLRTDLQAHYISSYDRTGGNDDGFNGTYSRRGDSHLRLRRLYDRSDVQEAEVWVNGHAVGVWYDPDVNPHDPEAESDFLIPTALTGNRSDLEIEIKPVRKGWSGTRYELWGIR